MVFSFSRRCQQPLVPIKLGVRRQAFFEHNLIEISKQLLGIFVALLKFRRLSRLLRVCTGSACRYLFSCFRRGLRRVI